MGRLNSGPGPGLCLLTLVVLIVAQAQSAPVQEDTSSPQSRAPSYYDGSSSELSSGCYYNFQHYGEGDRIITNEPCLNCTCHNRMLMCYLRVCPFTKAIGQNCTIEKKPGQCCPLIICPEVPVQLLTSSTTTDYSESFPQKTSLGYGHYGTAIGHLDDYGCRINGEFYTNGAQIPGNIDKPCEVCYCIRNRTACIMQECTLQVEGCIPVYEEGLCCPVRYQCDYEYNYNAITTEQPRPTPGLVLTTTSGPFECQHDNKLYADGAMVDTEDPCEHCYCMKGDIVCAVQECKPPFEKDGHNCTAMPPKPDKCCPDSYHCDGNEIVDESEPTFRQDRMHKFGQNNANVTMSITSSTSSKDKIHGWHYGTMSNENETPNRFPDEHKKDGTTKPEEQDTESEIMVTEGIPPTVGPLESGSHHMEGYGVGVGMRPEEKPSSQGHGVNTDNILTISQVIHSIVQNQTNLFNQNNLGQAGKPQSKPGQQDEKFTSSGSQMSHRPGADVLTDEEANPLGTLTYTTDFPDEYHGFEGGVPDIYGEHGKRPQKKPGQKKPGITGISVDTDHEGTPTQANQVETGGTQVIYDEKGRPFTHGKPIQTNIQTQDGAGSQYYPGKPYDSDKPMIYGEHGHAGRPQKRPVIYKKPGMHGTGGEVYDGTTEYPEGFTDKPALSSDKDHKQKVPGSVTSESMTDNDAYPNQVIHGTETYNSYFPSFDKRPDTEHNQNQGPGDEGLNENWTENYEPVTNAFEDFTGQPINAGHEISGESQKIPQDQLVPQKKSPYIFIDENETRIRVTPTRDKNGKYIFYDSYGRRFRGPFRRKRPGVMDQEENINDTKKNESPYIFYDEQGKKYTGPYIIKTQEITHDEDNPTENYEAVTEISQVFHNKPQTPGIPNDLTGQLHITQATDKKPSEKPTTDEHGKPIEGVEGVAEYPDGFTDKPGAVQYEIFYDKDGRPHIKPATDKKPGESPLTDQHGKPIEGVIEYPDGYTGKPGAVPYEIFYDKNGRPHIRPATDKKPGETPLTDEDRKPTEGVAGVTEYPEGFSGKPGSVPHEIFHDKDGRPQIRPDTDEKPGEFPMTDEHAKPIKDVNGVTEYPEGFTGKPGAVTYEIIYDKDGIPHIRPATDKKPGESTLTDASNPTEGFDGVTEYPEGHTGKPGAVPYEIFYDKDGKPHIRPVVKKPGQKPLTDEDGKPVEGFHGVTEYPEDYTGKPGAVPYEIFYDNNGKPHIRPATDKKPGESTVTDEDGKPMEGVHGVTEYPEGYTGKPGEVPYEIFYDKNGKPHIRPATDKKPGESPLTDEHGNPIEGVTEYPEGFSGKPGSVPYEIFYDKDGRPHIRPVDKKPGQTPLTDEEGKPIEGVDGEGVTEYPEEFAGKPGSIPYEIFYDKDGRPHIRPATNKKPGESAVTDEDGKPIENIEGVTEHPEGFSGKPDSVPYEIFYDKDGQPYIRPATVEKPGESTVTHEDGKPIEGVTKYPEGYTDKPGAAPYEIFYDKNGRPHIRPIDNKPGQTPPTDEDGKPSESVDGVTEYPEGYTSKPGAVPYEIFYDKDGKPHVRPATDKKPGEFPVTDDDGKPIEGVDGVTVNSEGVSGKPGSILYEIFYDKDGRPHIRPVYKAPGQTPLIDKDGKPIEGVTEYPVGFSGKPDSVPYEIFYDNDGRPQIRPATVMKPGESSVTDEDGKPIEGFDGVTEYPEGYTGKPGAVPYEIFYDKDGRPHIRPVDKKPGQTPLTDEDDKPIEGVTEYPEGYTGKPGAVPYEIFYDKDGRPHIRPATDMTPGEPIEGVTEYPEGSSDKPDSVPYVIFYDKDGRPHIRPATDKKPGESPLTDEDRKPMEGIHGVTEHPEGHTDKPGVEPYEIFYDQDGKPHIRPATDKKPGESPVTDHDGKPIEGVEGVTEYPDGYNGKPGAVPYEIFHDKDGRPHIRPVDKKPGQTLLTDEDGKPGAVPYEIFYDKDGRPHIRPATDKKPGESPVTDEDGKPIDGVEGVIEYPEGVSGTPGAIPYEIFYDQNGRPHIRPATDKKPGESPLTDEHGNPIEGVTEYPEVFSGKPGSVPYEIFYDKDGRPHIRPVDKKPGQTPLTDEEGKPIEGVDGATEYPEEFAGKPGSIPYEIFYDKDGRPHIRPVDEKPGESSLTDEDVKPIEGVTEYPEGFVGKPGGVSYEIFYDKDGRPHYRPTTDKKPGESPMTDQHGKPVEGVQGFTEYPEGVFGEPTGSNSDKGGDGESFFGESGRPQKKPIVNPDINNKAPTESSAGVSEVSFDGQDLNQPENVPLFDKDSVTTETGDISIEPHEILTDVSESGTEIFYDKHGRPYKKPLFHGKPSSTLSTKPWVGVTTESPVTVTGKPGDAESEIHYDKFGRPYERPVSVEKPSEGYDQTMTDEYTHSVTEVTMGGAGEESDKPDIGQSQRPINVEKPDMYGFDKKGKPTEVSQDHLDAEEDIKESIHDESGKPQQSIQEPSRDPVLTSEEGTSVEEDSDHPEEQTETPENDNQNGRPLTPTKPGDNDLAEEQGKPVGNYEGMLEMPDDMIGKPEHGGITEQPEDPVRPETKPTAHKKPGMKDGEESLQEHEKPGEGITPSSGTEIDQSEEHKTETVYDKYGRPYQKPIVQKKPGEEDSTNQYGEAVNEDERVTESAEKQTDRPEFDMITLYDEDGRPVKRPIVHAKPEVIKEQEKPIGSNEITTEVPESQTAKPEELPNKGQTNLLTNEEKNQIQGTPISPLDTNGKPQTGDNNLLFDALGRPYKKPEVPEKPGNVILTDDGEKPVEDEEGVTESSEGVTSKPDFGSQQVTGDELGTPHEKPTEQKTPIPAESDDVMNEIEKPTDEEKKPLEEIPEKPYIYGQHGQTSKPNIETGSLIPGPVGIIVNTDEKQRPNETAQVMTDTEDEKTYTPDKDESNIAQQETAQKKPTEKVKPGIVTQISEHDGSINSENDKPDIHKNQDIYNEPGHTAKPTKQPEEDQNVITHHEEHTQNENEVITQTPEPELSKPESDSLHILPEENRPQTKPADTTLTDEHVTQHTKPNHTIQANTKYPEDLTGKPGAVPYEIFYDKDGRPHIRPLDNKPGQTPLTDEDGKPIEGVTEYPEGYTGKPGAVPYEIFYDKDGRPHIRPATDKKPGESPLTDEHGKPIEGVTEYPEGYTGKPGAVPYEIFYGKDGKPHIRPVADKKPGEPIEGVTEYPEGSSDKPDSVPYIIFYDKDGRPHIRPATDKKPGESPPTDEDGKPIESVEGVTEYPEGYTGKPGAVPYEIFYDENGRPHIRPVDKKPGQTPLTDEDGKPVEGFHGVTEYPEGYTGKPGEVPYEIFYDKNGKPHIRPATDKKPGESPLTDEHGNPIEGVTEYPDGFSGKPGSVPYEIFYDKDGRPHIRPVDKKPGQTPLTDEEGKPIEGVDGATEYPEEFAGKPGTIPYEIFYDKDGRPHIRPATDKKPGESTVTDEDGKPMEGVQGVTKYPEDYTGKPGAVPYEIFYDNNGKPHIRPATDKKPGESTVTDEDGKPMEGVHGVTEYPEGYTGKPGEVPYEIFYDKNGKPHIRPATDKIPGESPQTDEHGKPIEGVEGVTEYPEGVSVKPGPIPYEIFYDKDGRPHIRPATDKEPGEFSVIDEDGKPIEGVTEYPEVLAGKPGSVPYEIFYDKDGRPHIRPVDKKPGQTPLTDEEGKPIEGVDGEGVTEYPEEFAGKPGSIPYEIFYDKDGRPHIRPATNKKPGESAVTDEDGKPIENIEGVTEHPEGFSGKPDSVPYEIFYDKDGQPYIRPATVEKPGESTVTHEDGKPIEGVTKYPEGYTDKPGAETYEIFYDKNGRPHIRPIDNKPGQTPPTDEDGKPSESVDGVTEYPEGYTSKPGAVPYEIFYDKDGKPHIRPPTDKKPGESPVTDHDGKPIEGVEGVTEYPEVISGKPGSVPYEIFYDNDGRPQIRPATDKKPGQALVTDEEGKPIKGVEAVTEYPEGVSGKPGAVPYEILYDKNGRPHIRPATDKKPGESTVTDEDGKPIEGTTEYPEGHTGKPGAAPYEIFYDKNGRPHIRPVDKKPGELPLTDEDGKPIEGVHGVTEYPDGFTGKPGAVPYEIFYDNDGTPHMRPATGMKPGESALTDEDGKPIEGVTEYPEGYTGKPGAVPHEIFYDKDGRPHIRPATDQKPGESPLTDEHGKPMDGVEGVTDSSSPSIQESLPFGEVEVSKDPNNGVMNSVEGVTEMFDQGSTEIYNGNAVIKPVSSVTGGMKDVDEINPEVGSGQGTRIPEDVLEPGVSVTGKPSHQEYPITTAFTTIEGQDTEQGLTKKPDEHGGSDGELVTAEKGDTDIDKTKPDGSDSVLSGTTEPQLFGEPGRPSKKPVLKPDSFVPGTIVDEAEEVKPQGAEEGAAIRPEYSTESHLRPESQEGIAVGEPTTKATTETEGIVQSSEKPVSFGGESPLDPTGAKPEENEIFGSDTAPEKDDTGTDEEISSLPDDIIAVFGKPGRPLNKPVSESQDVGIHEQKPESDGGLHHLSTNRPTLSEGPNAMTTEKAHTGFVQPNEDGITAEEDDDSLIITEDDSADIPKGTQKRPGDTSEKPWEYPSEPTTKVVEGVRPSEAHSEPTPGLQSSDDFTTPGYGTQAINTSPVTERDEALHLKPGEIVQPGISGSTTEEHVPEVNIVFDKDEKPQVMPSIETVTNLDLGLSGVTLTTPGAAGDGVEPQEYGIKPASEQPTDKDGQQEISGSMPAVTEGLNTEFEDGRPAPGESGGVQGTLTRPTTSDGSIEHDHKPEGMPLKEESSTSSSPHETDKESGIEENAQYGIAESTPEFMEGKPASTPANIHEVPGSTTSVPSDDLETGSVAKIPENASEEKPASPQLPDIPTGYLPPEESGPKLPILTDEGLHESSVPYDEVLNLGNVPSPTQTADESSDTTESHAEIPGEGSCFMDGVTYSNNSEVPLLSPCNTRCTCVSSIIHCLSIKCPPPPEDVSQCTSIVEDNSCCPIYVCGNDVSPTLPIENHEGEASTESTGKHRPETTPLTSDIEGLHKPTETLEGSATRKPDVAGHDATSHIADHTPTEIHKTDVKEPQKPEESPIKKPTVHEEDPQGLDKPSEGKPGRPQLPQSGYHPFSSDSQEPTALPPFFGTGKPEDVHPAESHAKPESDELATEKPTEGDTDNAEEKPGESTIQKPGDESVEPASSGTRKPISSSAEPNREDEKPGEDITGQASTEKPSEAAESDKHPETEQTVSGIQHKPDGSSSFKPGLTESDQNETGVQSIPTEEDVMKPDEKPSDSTSGQEKPQEPQESSYEITDKPVGEGVELQTVTHSVSLDKESDQTSTATHEKPSSEVEVGSPGKPGEPSILTTQPPVELSSTEETHKTPESDESVKEKPIEEMLPSSESTSSPFSEPESSHHESLTTNAPKISDHSSSSRPPAQDGDVKPSEDDEHKQTESSDTPMEVSSTKTPVVGLYDHPMSPPVDSEEPNPEFDQDSADVTHPETARPMEDSLSESEGSQKKPFDSTYRPDDGSSYSSTSSPLKPQSEKPSKPSDQLEDKKPQVEDDGAEQESNNDTTEKDHDFASGKPHGEHENEKEKPETDDQLTSVNQEISHTTKSPFEHPTEEIQEPHQKPAAEHPTLTDDESDKTPLEPVTEDMKPIEKPGIGDHHLDEASGIEKPHDDTTDLKESSQKPETEESTEGGLGSSTSKKPSVEGIIQEPVYEQKIPQKGTDMLPESVTKPVTEKIQGVHELTSTARPKPEGIIPGTHLVGGQNKPATDDIPEEVILHPTRMPGTYETARPEFEPVSEEDDFTEYRPEIHIGDDIIASILPNGFIHPITKRPIYGTSKPDASGDKDSTTPGDSLVHQVPHSSHSTDKPFLLTTKPGVEFTTKVPEDSGEISGTIPPVHGPKPDEQPESTTHSVSIIDSASTESIYIPQKPDQTRRPIYVTNGTHFIQYVPYKEDEKPHVPEGATLGEPEQGPNDQTYWPIIYTKRLTSTPEMETSTQSLEPSNQPIFNGTHFIQYLPYNDGQKPKVPEDATVGEPEKGADGQTYWPVISLRPLVPEGEKPSTEEPFQPYPGQIYNGTHFIQYVPANGEQEPEIPEGATLGEPEKASNGETYRPIISLEPIPEVEVTTAQRPLQSQPQQIFNGTHFIQYVPFDGDEPELPDEAILGQPQKSPDGQIYWPIIHTKPLPVNTEKEKPTTTEPSYPNQIFNGTNFIQYVPFKGNEVPEVPEGATLGQLQKAPDGQTYWPIIYMKPQPVTPEGPFPGQVFNGTHFIQYVPFKEGEKPEVPTDSTLGEPQETPDGQKFWPIISMKPVTSLPELKPTTEEPFKAQDFNGTHFIQYVPFTEGFEPEIPEDAVLGKPERKPDGEMYWPIIYQKLPTTPKPESIRPHLGQIFNGTHFIRYIPYRPSHKPYVPEGVTVSKPQKGYDGQMYWVVASTRPLPSIDEKPVEPQVFNGTHFIQYVPYEEGKNPEVPEGATLGKPVSGPGNERYWPIIYLKPVPGVPITHESPLDKLSSPIFDPSEGQIFNGTHYIQYVPYKPGKKPYVPEGGVVGHPTRQPDGEMYWPIIYLRPMAGVPIIAEGAFTSEQSPIFDSSKVPAFNGTHYVQYVPYKPGQRPVVPEGAILGQLTKRPDGQMYWPIIYLKPAHGTPTQGPMFWSPYDYFKPKPEQIYNGTHFILYLPYNPTQMPQVPEGASLGQPQKGPGGQMYWIIISDKPLPAQPFDGAQVVQYVTPVTPEEQKPQTEDQTRPIQVFNGTHYIQYVPYSPGQKPVVPEGAQLGQPTKGPEGQMFWPIIYMKHRPASTTQPGPISWVPSYERPIPQMFNGTHYIRFIPYKPTKKPTIPEGAILSGPQRRPDGQMYWVIASRTPLPEMQESFQPQPGQIFNGTHYIQFVPYNPSQMPEVPEGAVLGHPQKGPEGQMYWVIISEKPLPAQPGTQYVQYVTPVTPEEDHIALKPIFNGTHYIQYIPYKSAQVPEVPEDAVLGDLYKGPGGQMYWPIIYRRPPEGSILDLPYNKTGSSGIKPAQNTHDTRPINASSKPGDHPFWDYGQYASRPGNNTYPGQKPGTEEHAFWTHGYDKPQNGSDSKPATEYPSWSSGYGKPFKNATGDSLGSKLPSAHYGGSHHSKPGQDHDSGYYKPEKPGRPSVPDDTYDSIDEDHLIEYPSGSDYDENQEQPYGPGTCRYAGKVYVSAQQIPRDDPCDFCFCFRSDIICLQQSCPPPIPGCHEEPIQGFCCPRYECHVRMATLINVTSTTTTTTTTLPPHFLSHVYKGAAGRTGCFIQGKAFRVGQAIPSASGPCMDCICGGDGKMKCEPKVCTPEPMVRQMMVSSEKPFGTNQR